MVINLLWLVIYPRFIDFISVDAILVIHAATFFIYLFFFLYYKNSLIEICRYDGDEKNECPM